MMKISNIIITSLFTILSLIFSTVLIKKLKTRFTKHFNLI